MPKRHDHLFGQIANFQALRAAARRAIRGKRKKPGAASFQFGLERELLRLERELVDGTYKPGRYIEIELKSPKKRLVSAAPFRDRVVHHALCAVVGPIFENGFIGNTFANRLGKGSHKAIEKYEYYRDRHKHVLRCDIYRYFPSIDHAIIKRDLRRRLACERTLWLLDTIVDGSNRQEPVHLHFPGDDLLSPLERRRGLPIGNLTSQFLANLYLDPLDHFCTEVLAAPYVRYVDDFALFNHDAGVLADWRNRISDFLAGASPSPRGEGAGGGVKRYVSRLERALPSAHRQGLPMKAPCEPGGSRSNSPNVAFHPTPQPPPLAGRGRRLVLHPRKTFIAPVSTPAEFLGFVLHEGGKRALDDGNVRRFKGRLRGMIAAVHAGTLSRGGAQMRIDAWAAHADHAHARGMKRAILGRAAKALRARPERLFARTA